MDDMYNSENGNENYSGDGRYQQPTVQEQLQYQYQRPNDELEGPVTMGEWVISLLIMLVPCANIIMAFVWAFSKKEKKSKSNYFKAYLIFLAAEIVIGIILVIIYLAAIGSMINTMAGY